MFILTVLSYLPYAFVTAITPGPNNIIALYAVSQNGWKKGKNAVLGIGVGFLTVMLLCAAFCYQLQKYIPSVSGVLGYVGAAYIIWLAIHVARSKPENSEAQQITFWKGAFLQLVNVKIIMYAITAYTGYVLPVSGNFLFLIAHAVCFTVIGLVGTIVWAAALGMMVILLCR